MDGLNIKKERTKRIGEFAKRIMEQQKTNCRHVSTGP